MARFQQSSSWTRAETLILGDTRGPGGTRPRGPARTRPEAPAWQDSRSGGPRAGPGRVHAIGLVHVSARAADAPSWQAAPTVSRAERAEPVGGAVAGGGDAPCRQPSLPGTRNGQPERQPQAVARSPGLRSRAPLRPAHSRPPQPRTASGLHDNTRTKPRPSTPPRCWDSEGRGCVIQRWS